MKSPLLRYGYLNAKLRARMAEMRDSQVLEKAREAGSLLEVLEALKGTAYQELAEIYNSTGDLGLVEKALLERELLERQWVLGCLDEKPRKAASFLLQKIEIDNLKNTIRIWLDCRFWDLSPSNRMNYLLKRHIYSDVNWDELINSTSWEAFCKGLDGTVYQKACQSYSAEGLKNDQLAFLEMDLDKILYSAYETSLKELGGQDRKVATDILNRDIDLKNLLILMRYGTFYKLDSKRISSLLLQGGAVNGSKALSDYLASRDALGLVKRFMPALAARLDRDSFSGNALLETMLEIEHFLGSERKKEYTMVLRRHPFTMALVLAYFFVYDNNDRVLRTLLNAKAYKMDKESMGEFHDSVH